MNVWESRYIKDCFSCTNEFTPHNYYNVYVQVLIDPLRKVTSATTVNGLMQFCETSSQRCLLQALGLKLGVAAWINDFKEMHTRDYSNQFMRRISSTQPKVSSMCTHSLIF